LEICELGTQKTEAKLQPKVRIMEKSSKRGKIPQQDWPSIVKRYETGETLASIARTYDCSPPAISYIVSRSRARDANAGSTVTGVTGFSAPRLVKSQANEMPPAEVFQGEPEVDETSTDNLAAEASYPADGSRGEPQQVEPMRSSDEAADTLNPRKDAGMQQGNGPAHRHDQGQRDANPARNGSSPRSFGPVGAPAQNGEARHTLHLSLAHDDARRSDTQYQDASGPNPTSSGERIADRPTGGQQRFAQPGRHTPSHYAPATSDGSVHMTTEPHRTREGGAFIDQALRERVEGDITAFLTAFDAALAHDTFESRAGLREATDRLLRAGARTRIELERLEARVPLPPREYSG
jgi:hypothetical protein